MRNSTTYLNELAFSITRDGNNDRERAVMIHDYVRDQVRYGFTQRFDEASPSETLEAGVGHCNPQTTLFIELLRAVGIEAKYHFVTLTGEILQGVQPNAPALISHGFAEVRLDGRWIAVDSYIVDPAHAAGAAARLAREGREVGYGFHRDGTTNWDGSSSAFSQFADPSMVIEDHGTWDHAEDFFKSSDYLHKLGPINYTTLLGAMPSFMFGLYSGVVDRRLNELRNGGLSAALPIPADIAPQALPLAT